MRFPIAHLGLVLVISVAPQLPVALAFEDENYGYQEAEYSHEGAPRETAFKNHSEWLGPMQDGRRLEKFEFILRMLNIPLEPEPAVLKAMPRAGESSNEALLQVLRFIDPEGGLRRYLDFSDTYNRVDLYRDFFSHILHPSWLETQVELRKQGPSLDSPDLMTRLKAIQQQVRSSGGNRPLAGVRIAIDPGHMGDPFWDKHTGKFVEITKTVNQKPVVIGRVSEGQLTLWTALLTAQRLEDLGAEVRVLRERIGPVSTQRLQNYDIKHYIHQYFYDSLDSWMAQYLALSNRELERKIRTFPEVRRMFPTTAATMNQLRTSLYINGEDLEARSKLIDEFEPDLTLDIHFDASFSNRLQNRINDVEGYVPGHFSAHETGSRERRALALKHALEVRRWSESVQLTSAITASLANALELPLLQAPSMVINKKVVAVKVKKGVYARNLHITRKSTQGLVAYLECLHYDHEKEFHALKTKDKQTTIRGLTFGYPSRLDSVAKGIAEGVRSYFKDRWDAPGDTQFDAERLDLGLNPIEPKNSGNL